MNVQTEFSKYAEEYGRYNVIQRRVVDKLLADIAPEQPMRILDIGCGSGALYEALSWKPDYFVGIDFAPGMLERHPVGKHIECRYGDFNDVGWMQGLEESRFDRIFSASALQWAREVERTFSQIAGLKAPVSLALFTSETFATLFETAGIDPVLRSAEEISRAAACCFPDAVLERVRYQLAFESTREMFRYIKRSGVSGGRRVLGYAQTRSLMERYPLEYLEFEVLFVRT